MYKLEYLPAARQDMVSIAQYISKTLKNPIAAGQLITAFEKAINEISQFPYSAPLFLPIKPLKYEYRKFLVQNYFIFYFVNEEKKRVTISRIIYARRNTSALLEQ